MCVPGVGIVGVDSNEVVAESMDLYVNRLSTDILTAPKATRKSTPIKEVQLISNSVSLCFVFYGITRIL